jgi:hypothetical protein
MKSNEDDLIEVDFQLVLLTETGFKLKVFLFN